MSSHNDSALDKQDRLSTLIRHSHCTRCARCSRFKALSQSISPVAAERHGVRRVCMSSNLNIRLVYTMGQWLEIIRRIHTVHVPCKSNNRQTHTHGMAHVIPETLLRDTLCDWRDNIYTLRNGCTLGTANTSIHCTRERGPHTRGERAVSFNQSLNSEDRESLGERERERERPTQSVAPAKQHPRSPP